MEVNTEDFISEIENEPAIWNSSIDEYSNKIEKKAAWERVITKFYPESFGKNSLGLIE